MMRVSFRLMVVAGLFVLLMSVLEGAALAQSTFGPETYVRDSKKTRVTRTFTIGNAAIPYTLRLTHGNGDGSLRFKKGTLSLNGEVILGTSVLSRKFGSLVVAIHPAQQNELKLTMKGGDPGSFVSVAIEPTPGTVLNDPSNQVAVGFPGGVVVDQSRHKAYISDRHYDSVFEFDIASATITRRFAELDGDATLGNGATTGISFNPNTRTIVAVNQGMELTPGGVAPPGSLVVINLDGGSISTDPLISSQGEMHPYFVAVNPANNVAAFNAPYTTNSKKAYFMNVVSGAITTRSESVVLTDVAVNPVTNQFVFAGADDSSPILLLYDGLTPFRRIKKIASSARAGTTFDRLAINTATNIAVAVNQGERAVFLFDLTSGEEIARIPILVGSIIEPGADVAVNPQTNMAVVTSRYLDRVTVINLATELVMAEIPLPAGARPLGVDIDRESNRAVVSENGFSSPFRNGSIFVVQLPSP